MSFASPKVAPRTKRASIEEASSRTRRSNPLSKQSSDANSSCSSVFHRHSGSFSRSSSTESLLDDVSIKAKTMFSMLDCHGRGYLELDNLASCCTELSQDEITNLFNELDMDGDGKISIKDFKENFRSISKTFANKDRERRMSRLSSMSESMIQQSMNPGPNTTGKSQRSRFMSVDEGNEESCTPKSSQIELGEKFSEALSALSCQEQVIDLYQYIQIECPHLADSFEGIILDVIRDYHVYKTEIDKLDHLLIREKENHERQILQLDEELDSQIKTVEEKARREEREKLESYYSQQLYLKTQEIKALEESLRQLHEHVEQEQRKLQAAADSGFSALKSELNNLEKENRQLRNEISDWETRYALLKSELLRLKEDHQAQKREIHREQSTLSEFAEEKEKLSLQLSLLHQANRQLNDTNESLRTAMESHSSQPRLNSILLANNYASPPLPPPVQKISLQRPLSQPQQIAKSVENLSAPEMQMYQEEQVPAGAGMIRIDSCDLDSPVGDMDSGRSTLKDVAELESEMEDPSTLRKHSRIRQFAPMSSFHRSHLINPSEVDTAKESELETETERSPVLHQRSIASRPKTLPLPTTAERGSDSDSSKTSQTRRKSPRRVFKSKNKSSITASRKLSATSRSGSIQSVAEKPPIIKTSIEPPAGSQPESWFRIVMAGDAAVGKTSYIMRLCKNKFAASTQTTLGVDYHTKTLYLDGRVYGLQLWDTAGQERFRAMTRNFFRRADGVLLMYDCSYERSFLNVRHWIENIKDEADRNIPIMIVGNKTDLREKLEKEGKKCVSYFDGQRLAQENEALFIETSVKDGDNTEECVIEMTRLLKSTEDWEVQASAHVNLLNTQQKKQESSSCCSRF